VRIVTRLTALAGGALVLAGLVAAAPAGVPVATDAGAASVTTSAGPYPVGNAATGYLAELTDPTGSPTVAGASTG
jgi:hypothetical protein